MDMARRMASGEAAEILGSKLLEHDRMQRVLAMRVTAERLTAALPPDQRRLFDDYARGVECVHWLHTAIGCPPSSACSIYQPRPWQPVDSMLVVMSMVQMLDEHWPEKLERERITGAPGLHAGRGPLPPGSWRDHPPITNEAPLTAPNQNLPDVPLDESQDGSLEPSRCCTDDLLRVDSTRRITAHVAGAAGLDANPGSNQWVVSGRVPPTRGHAMLSNDMHLEQQIPNIWYETGLEAPGLHAAGVTVPGCR